MRVSILTLKYRAVAKVASTEFLEGVANSFDITSKTTTPQKVINFLVRNASHTDDQNVADEFLKTGLY